MLERYVAAGPVTNSAVLNRRIVLAHTNPFQWVYSQMMMIEQMPRPLLRSTNCLGTAKKHFY